MLAGALLAALVLVSPCSASAERQPGGRPERPRIVRKFLAVTGFNTHSGESELAWLGAGLGEELATRLATDKERFEVLERLQISNVLAAREVAGSVLDLDAEDEATGQAAAEALKEALERKKLYGADYLLCGSLTCEADKLRANTRLIGTATTVISETLPVDVPRTEKGLEHDLQALSIELARQWAEKLGGELPPEARRMSTDKAEVYRRTGWDAFEQFCLLAGLGRGHAMAMALRTSTLSKGAFWTFIAM